MNNVDPSIDIDDYYGYELDGVEKYVQALARANTVGIVPVDVYYRWQLGRWHVQTGIMVPLFWMDGRESPYRNFPPILLYVSGGLGDTE